MFLSYCNRKRHAITPARRRRTDSSRGAACSPGRILSVSAAEENSVAASLPPRRAALPPLLAGVASQYRFGSHGVSLYCPPKALSTRFVLRRVEG